MAKFKVGDKVAYYGKESAIYRQRGTVSDVSQIRGETFVTVDLDNGEEWGAPEKDWAFMNSRAANAKFKVGDRVRHGNVMYISKTNEDRLVGTITRWDDDRGMWEVKFKDDPRPVYWSSKEMVKYNSRACNGKFKINAAPSAQLKKAYDEWKKAKEKFNKWWNPDRRLSERPPKGADYSKYGMAFSDLFFKETGRRPPNGYGEMTLEQMLASNSQSGVRSTNAVVQKALNACARNYAYSHDPIKLMIQYTKKEDYGGIMDLTNPAEADSMGLYPADLVRRIYAKASKYYAGGRNMATPAQTQELVSLISGLRIKGINASCVARNGYVDVYTIAKQEWNRAYRGNEPFGVDAEIKPNGDFKIQEVAHGKVDDSDVDWNPIADKVKRALLAAGNKSAVVKVNPYGNGIVGNLGIARNACARNGGIDDFNVGDRVLVRSIVGFTPTAPKPGTITAIYKSDNRIAVKKDDGGRGLFDASLVTKNACGTARNAFSVTQGDVNRMCNEGLQAGKKLIQHINEWMAAIRDYQRNPNLQDKNAEDEYEGTKGLVYGFKEALRAMGW